MPDDIQTGAIAPETSTQTENPPQTSGSNTGPVDTKALHREATGSPQTQKEEQTYELKVKGKPVRVTMQQLMDKASMSDAAQQNFSEAKVMRDRADKILSGVKGDPIRALIREGAITKEDAIKAIEDYYYSEVVETSAMTDDQRKIREYEAKLKEYDDAKFKDEKIKFDKDQTDLTQKQIDFLSKEIMTAMDTHGLPKHPWFGQQIAMYMLENKKQGYNAPMSMIVDQVKNDYREMTGGISKNTPADKLLGIFEDLYGKDVMSQLRRLDLERFRKDKFSPQNPNQGRPGQASGKKETRSPEEILRDIRLGRDTF